MPTGATPAEAVCVSPRYEWLAGMLVSKVIAESIAERRCAFSSWSSSSPLLLE